MYLLWAHKLVENRSQEASLPWEWKNGISSLHQLHATKPCSYFSFATWGWEDPVFIEEESGCGVGT